MISDYPGERFNRRSLKVRDRDAPVTTEGLIFRVFGYSHPPGGCICDVEYAPEKVYRSQEPRSIRQSISGRYHKFYSDGGLQYVVKNYPQYQLFFEPLQTRLVGLASDQLVDLRKPKEKLSSLMAGNQPHQDKLLESLREVIDKVTDHSKLHTSDFGVFGSILHDFYHPSFSDLDLIVYGERNLRILRETLGDIYRDKGSKMVNEFDQWEKWAEGRHWHFRNISVREFCICSQKKMIYGVYRSRKAQRDIKFEFEPVKDWSEIKENYDPESRTRRIGWISAIVEIVDDSESFLIPSNYRVQVKKIIRGSAPGPVELVTSFVEEFRGQAAIGEKVLVEGNLEEVEDSKGKRYQITLTRTPDYYLQVLKPLHS